MSYRDQVVLVANNEAGVNWKENTPRILEYFQASTGQTWTRDNARKISWCTYFAHWVLIKAGVRPLPAVGTADGLTSVGGSVGRFLKYSPDALKKTKHDGNGVYEFHAASGGYIPRPGDLYYVPIPENHVGVIVGVDGKHIYSCDGNGGPKPGWDPRFYFSMQGKAVINRIGDGFIYKSGRPKALGVHDFFIELPDGG
ncbi:MAG: hypothetical protein QOI66_698 [Myxococcales bacterium]|jgi:hypothetical protein|nr:hypothetical protein [Myxococcales bacterium]